MSVVVRRDWFMSPRVFFVDGNGRLHVTSWNTRTWVPPSWIVRAYRFSNAPISAVLVGTEAIRVYAHISGGGIAEIFSPDGGNWEVVNDDIFRISSLEV